MSKVLTGCSLCACACACACAYACACTFCLCSSLLVWQFYKTGCVECWLGRWAEVHDSPTADSRSAHVRRELAVVCLFQQPLVGTAGAPGLFASRAEHRTAAPGGRGRGGRRRETQAWKRVDRHRPGYLFDFTQWLVFPVVGVPVSDRSGLEQFDTGPFDGPPHV